MPKTAMATVAAILLAGTGAAVQAQEFPKPDWADRPDPVASPYATVGGEVVVFAGQSPKSFNYYLDNNVFSAQVFGAMYESLLTINPMTLEYDPHLART